MAHYKIDAVEGIGTVYGEKLRSSGINDTGELLTALSTPAKRTAVAKETGIPEKNITRFANMVDLFRIKGVGPQYSELLEASGVDTTKELAQRVPSNLLKKMDEVNSSKNLSKRIPTEKELVRWIEEAKSLPRVIEY
ncbi:MAG: ferredoxin [Sulfuricurvum sp. RIFCSPHIGHO2_12_FULL_44_8]|nr:MAG: ferredoxin [Sulfuricurvum sp. RIFCSPHIGHO2_12_FULL_44_8]OHD83754.1 MAG: ferredoxin [Sulfuricurvum sp. RIFCSPHIGHO2_02_FULL_43_9]